MLHVHNRYVQQYKQVCQLSPAEVPQYDLVLLASGTPDKRRYNLPTANEVAGVMPGGLVGARGGGGGQLSTRCVLCWCQPLAQVSNWVAAQPHTPLRL